MYWAIGCAHVQFNFLILPCFVLIRVLVSTSLLDPKLIEGRH